MQVPNLCSLHHPEFLDEEDYVKIELKAHNGRKPPSSIGHKYGMGTRMDRDPRRTNFVLIEDWIPVTLGLVLHDDIAARQSS